VEFWQISREWHVVNRAINLCVIKELTMLQLVIACLVIALIAAVLGFGGIAGSFVGVAKILFVVFLVLAIVSFLFGGGMSRGRI
jgi:uncharacterized membrane protein YtjA (UPF0391 family)